ncbi:YjgB family protein [Sulfobacillus harzensis]|uniref:YjgB family protein n=1 Tax=Sulfobacillus harzensis TaxID=2729629 RepID=A0A7Y0Q4A4_9FIRM|nr:YjgB family protein [Sulfobacillus harzensis]NMP24215.1 YjgB family protein [Sulfobacillus harzensis]
MTKKSLGISALILGSSAVLAGCGIASHPTAALSRTSQPQTSASASTPPTTSTPTGAAASTPTTAAAQSPTPSKSTSAQSLVREWAKVSLVGKALGIPYGDQQSYYALEKVWGQGTNGPDVNHLHYVSYGAHNAVVGFNEGVQLADVRSYNPDLHQITLSDIEAVLGKPDSVSHSAGSVLYTYNQGPYRLLWVFSGSASTVAHVDVQWPKGMVAPMAAEIPPHQAARWSTSQQTATRSRPQRRRWR